MKVTQRPFPPKDPPLATGKRLRDEPGEGFGVSFPAPHPCVVMSAVCTALLVLCLSLPWEERRGEPEEQIKLLVPCGLMNELL